MDLCEAEKPNYESERVNFSLIFQGFFFFLSWYNNNTTLPYITMLKKGKKKSKKKGVKQFCSFNLGQQAVSNLFSTVSILR